MPRSANSDSVKTLLGRDESALLQVQTAHAEVAQFVLVREPPDVGAIANTPPAQLELQVHDVLERRAFAGAGAVTGADEEACALAPRHPFDQLVQSSGRFGRVGFRAHRQAVALGPETRRGAEVELRTGGVDQEVVPNLLPHAR